MNPLQMAQQIKHVLEQAVWPGDGGHAVFGTRGSVAVFAGAPTEEQIPAGLPFCLVGIDNGTFDDEDPNHLIQQFTLIVGAEVAGDPLGENALIGGSVQNLLQSAGRGVAEVSERVRIEVQDLTGADGAMVQLSGTSTSAPSLLGRARHIALQDLTLTAACTSAAYFSPPSRLRWEPHPWRSGGFWRWDGDHCTARYDFAEFTLMRKQGTQPSLDVDDGDILYHGATAEFEAVKSNGYTYTVIASYASRGNTLIDGYSEPETGSYRVV